MCLEMEEIVLDPFFVRVPTLFSRRPNSLSNEVNHTCAVGPCLSYLYFSDSPVCGSIIKLIAYMVPCSRIDKAPAAMVYCDETVELLLDNVWRLLATYCWMKLRVG